MLNIWYPYWWCWTQCKCSAAQSLTWWRPCVMNTPDSKLNSKTTNIRTRFHVCSWKRLQKLCECVRLPDTHSRGCSVSSRSFQCQAEVTHLLLPDVWAPVPFVNPSCADVSYSACVNKPIAYLLSHSATRPPSVHDSKWESGCINHNNSLNPLTAVLIIDREAASRRI